MAWRVMLWGVKIHLVMLVLVLLWFHANNGEIVDHWALVAVTLPLHLMASIKSARTVNIFATEKSCQVFKSVVILTEAKHFKNKGSCFWPPDCPKVVTKFTKEQRLESLIDWKVAFFIQEFFIYFLWGRGCVNTRCQSHSTSGFARLSDWGKKWRLSTGYNGDYLW